MLERIIRAGDEMAASRTARFSPEVMRQIEKAVLLQTLDHLWREHLIVLDHLRQVIGFRGYAQRDPLIEYKTESFEHFQRLLTQLREAVTRQIMHIEIVQRPPPLAPEGDFEAMQASHPDPDRGVDAIFDESPADGRQQPVRNARYTAGAGAMAAQIDPNDPATWGKVPRNAPCPCGSGKKYKHCHGRLAYGSAPAAYAVVA